MNYGSLVFLRNTYLMIIIITIIFKVLKFAVR